MKKKFKSFDELIDYYGLRNMITKPSSSISTNEYKECIEKPLSTMKIKKGEEDEHKSDNIIRLQITIDCRIL